jgi:hypothetical protein
MSKDYLIVPDPHAHPDHHNERADWLGKFILDRKPDVVVNMGDTWDLPSLSSFDKGKASFNGANYEKDMDAGLDFQDRMWHPIKHSKKKQPRKVFLEGNHEHRLSRVLEYEPHLAGDRYGISYKNFQLDNYYHDVVMYEGGTPGIITLDGISFAHFFVAGLMGRPIGGEHHAASLIAKNYSSCVAAHSHTVDWAVRSGSNGKTIMGLVAGVFQDFDSGWAGACNNLWWRGLVYLKNVEDGVYEPEFISMASLKKEYGSV